MINYNRNLRFRVDPVRVISNPKNVPNGEEHSDIRLAVRNSRFLRRVTLPIFRIALENQLRRISALEVAVISL